MMIYISTALYYEAYPFIEKYRLKSCNLLHGFSCFQNEEQSIVLVVTGVGKIQAACGLTQLLTVVPPGYHDYLFIYGSSAGEKTGLFLANQIWDMDIKKFFYPDMLFDFGVEESRVWTGSLLIDDTNPLDFDDFIYDMESSALYQAGIHFFGPHQMFFFRFVSDANAKEITPDQLKSLAITYAQDVIKGIDALVVEEESGAEDSVFEQQLAEKCRCSVTMERELHQLFRYARVSGKQWESFVEELLQKDVSSREEGKKVIYAFRQFLIS